MCQLVCVMVMPVGSTTGGGGAAPIGTFSVAEIGEIGVGAPGGVYEEVQVRL